MKHSAGDKVKVIDNLFFHCFKIGQEVNIESVREGSQDYHVNDGGENITRQVLTDDELEKIS